MPLKEVPCKCDLQPPKQSWAPVPAVFFHLVLRFQDLSMLLNVAWWSFSSKKSTDALFHVHMIAENNKRKEGRWNSTMKALDGDEGWNTQSWNLGQDLLLKCCNFLPEQTAAPFFSPLYQTHVVFLTLSKAHPRKGWKSKQCLAACRAGPLWGLQGRGSFHIFSNSQRLLCSWAHGVFLLLQGPRQSVSHSASWDAESPISLFLHKDPVVTLSLSR